MDKRTDPETLIDFISGRPVPNVGAEENRQAVERFLVEQKGFARSDIEVDAPITVAAGDDTYRSKVDLVVRVDRKIFMCIKCAPGSLGSREREIVAAGRLLAEYQAPYSAVSDGKTAILIETVSGRKIAEGLQALPDAAAARAVMQGEALIPLPEDRRKREGLIFRSYDSMNVNRA